MVPTYPSTISQSYGDAGQAETQGTPQLNIRAPPGSDIASNFPGKTERGRIPHYWQTAFNKAEQELVMNLVGSFKNPALQVSR